jgi:hypothetical protein
MLARFESGDGHWRVPGVGRGDRYDVDSGIRDDRAPVGGRSLKAELVGAPPCEVFVDLAQHEGPNGGRVAEHGVNAGPG